MAILGYNTKGPSAGAFSTGRMYTSKFTLGSPQTMTELHGWFLAAGTANTVRLVIYADSAGSPGARVAYSSLLALAADTADHELSETGFSVALASGDYWIGWKSTTNIGSAYYDGTIGSYKGILSSAADPPPDPFGSVGTSGTRQYSCWAVVGAAAGPTFVPQIVIT